MHNVVVSLWSLLEACRADQMGGLLESARAAQRAVRAAAGAEGVLSLEVVDQRLVVEGSPVVHSVDTFAATQGLMSLLGAAGVQRVQFAADVDADSLAVWGRIVADRQDQPEWPAGVVVTRLSESPSNEVVSPQSPPRAVERDEDSRLRSVFLQHRLIACLPPIEGVDSMAAKSVVERVVDRLLQVPGGLEPLMLLQQDEDLLRRSIAVSVLTVVFAGRMGWPVELLADIGAAGLLHDLGAIVDRSGSDAAAFQWLLNHGEDDFWLRCALVARRWRDQDAASADLAGPLGVISVVRMAVAFYRDSQAGLDALEARGAAPVALLQVARAAVTAG